MTLSATKLVFFSPTGTTKTILQAIAKGINSENVATIDYTRSIARINTPPEFHDEIVILGVPVYYGRVPPVAADFLARLSAKDTPVIAVVLYGNRAYEDALIELHDLAVNSGFQPIAAGAFIGEHSFSTEGIPIAHGRPDPVDIQKAEEFGRQIREILNQWKSNNNIGKLTIPGNRPYQPIPAMPKLAPETNSACNLCGICVEICPTSSIIMDNPIRTNNDSCILCSACIKACTLNARVNNQMAGNIAKWLHKNCQERKEPEIFLPISYNKA